MLIAYILFKIAWTKKWKEKKILKIKKEFIVVVVFLILAIYTHSVEEYHPEKRNKSIRNEKLSFNEIIIKYLHYH